MKNKLELTWVGKDEEVKVEPRILIEDPSNSNIEHDSDTQNMLIHGDNLLALKPLEAEFAGQVKCIYIDPPYNTGSAFEHYDDNLEHSIWLDLMYRRLEILRNLLDEEGVIFVQIDDNEQAYLKVMMDEIYGRNNFINCICVKAKASSGASGGGEDRRLKKNIEYILVYSKSGKFKSFETQFEKCELNTYISNRKNNGTSFAYNSVMYKCGKLNYVTSTEDGTGDEIKIYRVEGAEVRSVNELARENGVDPSKIYYDYIDSIFTLENAQTSIRTRVKNSVPEDDGYYIAEYVPKSGKNKGSLTQVGFMGRTKRLVSYLRPLCVKERNKIFKLDKVGTLWSDISWSSIKTQGGVDFDMSKKPEALVDRVIRMATNPGDLVLDSFLGSGTTAAVAHKMGRRWIGIEMGEHAYTHCKVRLDKVVTGEDTGGITSAVDWQGGGGYKFYELAPTLIETDSFGEAIINKDYDANMLASAVALHEGFKYSPDVEFFWKQSVGSENSYLFVTTRHIDNAYLESIQSQMAEDEYLTIACTSFSADLPSRSRRVTIKKIPEMLLDRCEFGKNDYNLNIVNPPVYDVDTEEDDD